MARMTKSQFENLFRTEVLPYVIERYEQDGIPDKPARREAWNDTVDAYIRDRELPKTAGDWMHPRWLETWRPPERNHARVHHSTAKKKSTSQLDKEIAETLRKGRQQHATKQGFHTLYDLVEVDTRTNKEAILHKGFSTRKDAKEAQDEYKDMKRPNVTYRIRSRQAKNPPYRWNLED